MAQTLAEAVSSGLLRGGETRSPRLYSRSRAYEVMVWVYVCANKISDSISGVPTRFYLETSDGGKEYIEDKDHPVLRFFNRPDPPGIPTFKELVRRTYIHLSTDGVVHWVLYRSEGRESGPYDVLSLRRVDSIRPFHDPATGALEAWIEVDPNGVPIRAYNLNEVMTWANYNPRGGVFDGLSPLVPLQITLEQEFSQAKWNEGFFRRGLRHPLAISFKRTLSKTQRHELDRDLTETYGGVSGGHGALILGQGADVTPLAANSKDLEFSEGKRLNREEVCAAYGIPPVTVGILDKANYANSREQRRALWQDSLLPRMSYATDMIQFWLLDQFFEGVLFEFDTSAIEALQPDHSEQSSAVEAYMRAGYTKEEISVIMGNPALAGMPAESEAPEAPESDEEPDEGENPDPEEISAPGGVSKRLSADERYAESHLAIIDLEEARWTTALRRFYDQILSTVYRRLDRGEPVELNEVLWADIWTQMSGPLVRRTFETGGEVALLEVGALPLARGSLEAVAKQMAPELRQVDISEVMTPDEYAAFQRAIDAYNNKVVRIGPDQVNRLNAELGEALRGGGTVNDLRKRAKQIVDEYYSGRALTIARTTANAAYNNAKQTVFTSKNVSRHKWISARDAFVRESHEAEDGSIVDRGEPFPNTRILYPHDPAGPAGEVINCRCTVVAAAIKRPENTNQTPPASPTDQASAMQTTARNQAVRSFLKDLTLNPNLKVDPHKQDGYPSWSFTQREAFREHGFDIYESQHWKAIQQANKGSTYPDESKALRAITDAKGETVKISKEGRQRIVEFLFSPLREDLREGVPRVGIRTKPGLQRAYYHPGEEAIYMGESQLRYLAKFFNNPAKFVENNASTWTNALEVLAHEFGHHLQYFMRDKNGDLIGTKFAKDMIEKRTPNKATRELGGGEKALEDEFYHPYQGRFYSWGERDTQQNPEGTEVLSMYYQKVALMPWYEGHFGTGFAAVARSLGEGWGIDEAGFREVMELFTVG